MATFFETVLREFFRSALEVFRSEYTFNGIDSSFMLITTHLLTG